jgi:DNA sulfur modification protein DndD
MHLQELTLRNWRSFRSATFKFNQPRGNKKVILVGAMNGVGKTSILMALHLGLFGREAMPFLQGIRLDEGDEVKSYKQLIEHILHRPAKESDAPTSSVKLVFNVGGEELVITRTWHYRRGGEPRDLKTDEGEEIVIEQNNRLLRIANWKDGSNRISNILFPAHIAPCFFFDGEQAQERVEAAGGRAVYDAIQALYGTRLLTDLEESLRTYISNTRSSLRRDHGSVELEELDTLRAKRDGFVAELEQTTQRLAKVKQELAAAEQIRTRAHNELSQLTEDVRIDLDQLARRKSDLTQQESELRQRLTDALSDAAFPLALARLAGPVERQLQAEAIRDRWELLRDETLAKVDSIVSNAIPRAGTREVDPPLTDTQFIALESKLRGSLEALWSPPPAGCAENYRFGFLSASERTTTLHRARERATAGAADIASLATEWQATQVRRREVDARWDNVSDIRPRVEGLKKTYDDADRRVRELNEDRTRIDSAERGKRQELNDLNGSIGRLEGIHARLAPAEQKLELGERVRSVILETKDSLVPLCKKALAEACTEHFRNMISDEYRNYVLDFDDGLQPVLRGQNHETIYVSTMSGAQKRAFGLAFSLALAQASGEEAPIVIDTPVGNMDSEYRQRILQYVARTAPGQVIFLSHDEEIYGPYASALEASVLQKFWVEFTPTVDGAGISTPHTGRYFEARG